MKPTPTATSPMSVRSTQTPAPARPSGSGGQPPLCDHEARLHFFDRLAGQTAPNGGGK